MSSTNTPVYWPFFSTVASNINRLYPLAHTHIHTLPPRRILPLLSDCCHRGLKMGKMCDTHINTRVKDEEQQDHRRTALPHDDSWWISRTDLLTSRSAFPVFPFVHSQLKWVFIFLTGIWCEQKPSAGRQIWGLCRERCTGGGGGRVVALHWTNVKGSSLIPFWLHVL